MKHEPRKTIALPDARLRDLLKQLASRRVLVLGDVMLDQFIWGTVRRISPEAPVPVVEFQRESHMPGGAANVARNISSLGGRTELFGLVGRDHAAGLLSSLLAVEGVGCRGLVASRTRPTSLKTRIVAHQQQMVRLDREINGPLDERSENLLLERVRKAILKADALIVGDYGKGVVTQTLLDRLKPLCRERGVWLSLDPKPVHKLELSGLSLITPNRKEAFELAGLSDDSRHPDPLKDASLMLAVRRLLEVHRPGLLLVTLGDLGMLLCRRGDNPFHIPTVAKEVFDVSGAGDTVIASFTLAIAAGASPIEAAIISNHAAGVVVGKVGTATVTQAELIANFQEEKHAA